MAIIFVLAQLCFVQTHCDIRTMHRTKWKRINCNNKKFYEESIRIHYEILCFLHTLISRKASEDIWGCSILENCCVHHFIYDKTVEGHRTNGEDTSIYYVLIRLRVDEEIGDESRCRTYGDRVYPRAVIYILYYMWCTCKRLFYCLTLVFFLAFFFLHHSLNRELAACYKPCGFVHALRVTIQRFVEFISLKK